MKFPIKLTNLGIVNCSELKVKHYKELLKSMYGDTPSISIFTNTLIDIYSKLLKIKKEILLKNLTVHDLFMILIEIRSYSLGGTFSVVIKDKQVNADTTVELSFDKIKEDMAKHEENNLNHTIDFNSVSLEIRTPTIEKILGFIEENSEELYLSVLNKLKLKDREIDIQTYEQSRILFDSLPPKASLTIIDYYNKLLKSYSEINFLARYEIADQHLCFAPNLHTLLWFSKLFFTETLSNLYDNIFYLSIKGSMSANYIENCNPGEYTFFVKKLQQWIKEQNEPSNDNMLRNDLGNNDNE